MVTHTGTGNSTVRVSDLRTSNERLANSTRLTRSITDTGV